MTLPYTIVLAVVAVYEHASASEIDGVDWTKLGT
jgi:hypothetical protein